MAEQVVLFSSCVFYFVGGNILGKDFIKEVLMMSSEFIKKNSWESKL